jgi:hypothetical protein
MLVLGDIFCFSKFYRKDKDLIGELLRAFAWRYNLLSKFYRESQGTLCEPPRPRASAVKAMAA